MAKRPLCGRCRHSATFHGKNRDKPCGAMGCNKGDDGQPCPSYLEPTTGQKLTPEFRSY